MTEFLSSIRDAQFADKILFATFLVGIIYAYLTYKLWREANFQSVLSISPYVIFQIHDKDGLYQKILATVLPLI